jgi:hypothetical protein
MEMTQAEWKYFETNYINPCKRNMVLLYVFAMFSMLPFLWVTAKAWGQGVTPVSIIVLFITAVVGCLLIWVCSSLKAHQNMFVSGVFTFQRVQITGKGKTAGVFNLESQAKPFVDIPEVQGVYFMGSEDRFNDLKLGETVCVVGTLSKGKRHKVKSNNYIAFVV